MNGGGGAPVITSNGHGIAVVVSGVYLVVVRNIATRIVYRRSVTYGIASYPHKVLLTTWHDPYDFLSRDEFRPHGIWVDSVPHQFGSFCVELVAYRLTCMVAAKVWSKDGERR